MSVLVDTSVWVNHFKQYNGQLADLLETGGVVCHPYVVVEVACGTPPSRRDVIHLLGALNQAPLATHEELLGLIDLHALQGRGCGFVDISLLASALLNPGTRLWTHDRRLNALAAELGIHYRQTSLS